MLNSRNCHGNIYSSNSVNGNFSEMDTWSFEPSAARSISGNATSVLWRPHEMNIVGTQNWLNELNRKALDNPMFFIASKLESEDVGAAFYDVMIMPHFPSNLHELFSSWSQSFQPSQCQWLIRIFRWGKKCIIWELSWTLCLEKKMLS